MRGTESSILLTGGTGFFGRALLRHWMNNAACGEPVPHVTVLTRAPEPFLAKHPEFGAQPWMDFHEGDVLERDTLPPGGGFTHILHAATDSTLGPRLTPLQRYDQIVDGTRNLLDFAVQTKVRRFLLTSSGGVYGPPPPEFAAISETYLGSPDTMNPANAYSMGKRSAEHLCALYQERFGVETVVARCFAFVGEDLPMDAHFAIGNFIRDALRKDAITVQGDGTAVRSYLDQRDLAQWLLAILERGVPGRAYNVGSDEAITIADLARLVRDVLAPAKDVVILGRPDDGQRCHRYVPDIGLARNELGLRVEVRLSAAIAAAGEFRANHIHTTVDDYGERA